MKFALVAFCAFVVAVIMLECVRNKDYEDGVLGRVALWFLFGAAAARFSQIMGGWIGPYFGEGWTPGWVIIDNVEVSMWLALFFFFTRHYYRFRGWRVKGKYAWRRSEKRVTHA